jgi:hypothetical protein
VSRDVLVRSGGTGFYALPNAKFELACEGSAGGKALRSWSASEAVRAQVMDGDVVLWTSDKPMGHVPLRRGEVVKWTNAEQGVSIMADGELMLVTDRDNPTKLQDGEMLRYFLPRLLEFEKNGFTERRYVQQMRQDRVELERALLELEKVVNLQRSILIEDDITLDLSTSGDVLKLRVTDPKGTSTFEHKSVEDLRAAVPARVAELLKGFDIKVNDAGKFDIGGVSADAHGAGEKKIRIHTHQKTK